MNVKRIIFSIALQSCLLLCSCRSSEYVVHHSRWQLTPVVADGIATEWEIPLRYYNKGGKLGCTVSNDLNNLYICIRSSDQETRMKMIRSGMTVAIDTSEKKTNLFSINYPLPKERTQHSHEEGGTQVSSYPSLKQRILQDRTTMNISGFINTQNGESPLKTLSGLKVCMNLDSFDIFTYEAIVPLKTFYKEQLVANDTSKVLNVYITVNGMTTPGNSGMSGGGGYKGGGARMGAGAGGHMGGGHGGGAGGRSGGAGAGMGDMAARTEPEKLQIQFRLNFK